MVRQFFLGRLLLAERNRPLMKVVMGEALVDPEFAEEFSRKVTEPAMGADTGICSGAGEAGRVPWTRRGYGGGDAGGIVPHLRGAVADVGSEAGAEVAPGEAGR